jgi:hypothetical protein
MTARHKTPQMAGRKKFEKSFLVIHSNEPTTRSQIASENELQGRNSFEPDERKGEREEKGDHARDTECSYMARRPPKSPYPHGFCRTTGRRQRRSNDWEEDYLSILLRKAPHAMLDSGQSP